MSERGVRMSVWRRRMSEGGRGEREGGARSGIAMEVMLAEERAAQGRASLVGFG